MPVFYRTPEAAIGAVRRLQQLADGNTYAVAVVPGDFIVSPEQSSVTSTQPGARRWKTWPITLAVFLFFFVSGFEVALKEASRYLIWSPGFDEFDINVILKAIEMAIPPSAVAFFVCLIHNLIARKHARLQGEH
jgi:hypothetical protein